MTIDQINAGYVITILIALSAIVSGVAVLAMGSKKNCHFFAKRAWAYFALIASVCINVFFVYNIFLWLSTNYVKIGDEEFHIRWLIYHTCEKSIIFMFHHNLYTRVKEWRASDELAR